MKQLPGAPNLAHLKKQAKDLRRGYGRDEPEAVARVAAILPDHRRTALRLSDAQRVVAREYGFASWPALKTLVEWKSTERQGRTEALRVWFAWVFGAGFQSARPSLARKRLEEGLPVTDGDEEALWVACAVGNEAALRDKLSADLTVVRKRRGDDGMTPLLAVTHSCFTRDDLFAAALERCAELLIAHGADPNEAWIDPAFPDGRLSALYGAAGRNHVAGMTRLLLRHGANPNDNESLYHSVESTDLTCTKLLLEGGARVSGSNALARVLDFDRIEGLRLLLAHGGDANERWPGKSLLFHAIRRGRSIDHVRLLLAHGADVNVVDADGLTPFRYALRYGMPEVAALLRGARDQGSMTTEEAFVVACACADRAEALRLSAGAPGLFERLTEQDLRLLPDLAAQGNLPAVQVMVGVGWPISVRGGDWDASALNHAVFGGNAEMVGYLLDHGASWEERHGFDDNAMGTLSFASRNSSPDSGARGDWVGCARVLIAHGMPVPPPEYAFSEEVAEYFDGLDDAD